MIEVLSWKMYMKIQNKKQLKFSQRQTAEKLNLGRNTVIKYWDMDPKEYHNYIQESKTRKRLLDPYNETILGWLMEYPDLKASQIADWLKEHFNVKDLKERTVRRHVSRLREEHNIPKKKKTRDYQAVQLLPPGKQVQVDFGEKVVMRDTGLKIKLYFIAFILSHSRLLYAYFLDRPFKTQDLIIAFQLFFMYIDGMPEEVAIDQDSLMVVSENSGDIVYTYEFERFIHKNHLKMFVCRKSDPESKGIVESGAVRYIKHSFMPHRKFSNLKSYQLQFEAWLERTANKRIHHTTKKVPAEVFLSTEKHHLRPAPTPEILLSPGPILTRNVNKDNTIWFKSNRYTVPLGTYNRMKQVEIRVDDDRGILSIFRIDDGEFIAQHQISLEKGKLIQNRNHLRDYTQTIKEQIEGLVDRIGESSRPFLEGIREEKPRYIRDQCRIIQQLLDQYPLELIQESIVYCTNHRLFSASDLRDVTINGFNLGEIRDIVKTPVIEPKAIEEKIMTVDTVKRDISLYCELVGGMK